MNEGIRDHVKFNAREYKMNICKKLKGKGLGVSTSYSFEEDEPSSMIHEQLARLKFIESKIEINSKRVLDFGCGTGYNSYYLSTKYTPEQVLGVDILEECISHCRNYYLTDKTEYYVQDCLVYNKDFGSFDVILSCEVIEHVVNQSLFLDILIKYLKDDGVACISTPNKALFSLCKEKSFLNHTHLQELFYSEFSELLSQKFKVVRVYSQIHKGIWHSAYVNYLSVVNIINALRCEIYGDNIVGRIVSKIASLLYIPIFLTGSRKYPDVRKRKYSDFEFIEGYEDTAVWFIALCREPILLAP